jgi:predicted peptidase
MSAPRIMAFLFVLGTLILFKTPAGAATQTGFLNRTVTVGKQVYRYQVYIPAEWNKGKKWPVILFLHGAGERGDDGLFQTQVGIAAAIRTHPEHFQAVIVMPQCRKDIWWTDPAMEEQALAALKASIREFKGDQERIYLTGLSMGGYGTWDIAAKHAGMFAALAPICGGLKPPGRSQATDAPKPDDQPAIYAEVAGKIGKTPVWIFHGGADPVVPVAESQKMYEALKVSGGNVKYTEYPGVGHNSWDRAYSEPEFMTWLLSQRLSRQPGFQVSGAWR